MSCYLLLKRLPAFADEPQSCFRFRIHKVFLMSFHMVRVSALPSIFTLEFLAWNFKELDSA